MKNMDTVSICIDGHLHNVEIQDIEVIELESIVQKVGEFSFRKFTILVLFQACVTFDLLIGSQPELVPK